MITTQDVLCQFLQAELWQKKLKSGLELTSEQYNRLASLATEQTVLGLIGSVLISNNVKLGKYDMADIFNNVGHIRQRNKKMDSVVAELATVLNEASIGYAIVKGQTIAPFYPNPDMRVSGDIDMYLNRDDFSRFKQVMESHYGVSVPEFTSNKHVAVDIRETDLEIHWRLTDIYRNKGARYWEDIYRDSFSSCYRMKIGGADVAVLNPTLNVLYVFVHLFYHLLLSGVSLRQFCDWAMILHHSYVDDSFKIDSKLLQTHLEHLNLYDVYCAFGTVLVDVLGLEEKEFLFDLKDEHRKYTQKILGDIFAKGNFGKYNRKVHSIGWAHSIETGKITMSHLWKYYRLAPKELSAFLPKQIATSIKVNLLRKG